MEDSVADFIECIFAQAGFQHGNTTFTNHSDDDCFSMQQGVFSFPTQTFDGMTDGMSKV